MHLSRPSGATGGLAASSATRFRLLVIHGGKGAVTGRWTSTLAFAGLSRQRTDQRGVAAAAARSGPPSPSAQLRAEVMRRGATVALSAGADGARAWTLLTKNGTLVRRLRVTKAAAAAAVARGASMVVPTPSLPALPTCVCCLGNSFVGHLA